MDIRESIKKLEPKQEMPDQQVKNELMSRLEFRKAVNDIVTHFSNKMGKSALDLLKGENPNKNINY